MQGYKTPWQPGTGQAVIATQNIVERVWKWKSESGVQIAGQMRRLGDGVVRSRDRFTMDEGLSRAVRTVLKKM